jgi:hypothetical protein
LAGQSSDALITAKDIVNEKTGLISTQLPTSLISAIGNAVSSATLTLNASGALTNEGKIVSAGSLSLLTGLGILANSGTVSSLNGNINIAAPSPTTDLNISATAGVFQAVNGAINVRSSDYNGTANVNLSGGNYLSNALNIYSGSGTINGVVENITGQVNTRAGIEHLAANTANLILGTNTVTGDPTFVNNGDITISGVNTFSEDVAIIANGNIIGTNGAEIVDTGHSVILIAGVAPGAGSPSTASVTDKSSGITGSTTIDFASSSNKGGSIDFTASAAATAIDTSSSTYTAGGGDVILAAFAKGATGGSVLFNSSASINTNASIYGSTGTNNGGNVNIIAGANPTTGTTTVQVGNITTNGSNGQILSGFNGQPTAVAGAGGAVNITTAQPTGTGGTAVTFNSVGDITAGGPIVASSTLNGNAQVTVGNILTGAAGQGGPASGGNINIKAGDSIATGSLSTFGTTGAPEQNFQFPVAAHVGGNAGSISILSKNAGIVVSGAINAAGGSGGAGGNFGGFGGFQSYPGAAGGNGGTTTIQSATGTTISGSINNSGGAGGSGVLGSNASSGGAGGNAGSVAVSTTDNGTISIAGDVLAVGGAGGNGGKGVVTSFPPSGAINGVSGSAGGNGANIQIMAGAGMASVDGILNSGGGTGGTGGNGADGSPNSPASTAGGQGGNGGTGGAAGAIIFQAGTTSTVGGITAVGGAGGNAGNGGNGVPDSMNSQGATGGNGGSGGNGGAAGTINYTATNFSGPLTAIGGKGGLAGGDGTLATGPNGANGANGLSADISATASGTTSGAITGNNITLSSPSAVSLTLADNVTAAQTLTINAGGILQITGSTTVASGQSVAINGAPGNDLTVQISGASNAILASSGDIKVTGSTGNSVTINNAGTISALNGNIFIESKEAVTSVNAGGNITIGGGGTLAVGNGIIDISANTQSGSPAANRIEFSGSQNFNGNVVLNAGGNTQLVQVDDGATVTGNSTVTVNSSTLFEIGSGTLIGNPLVINSQTRGGVIANTNGTLDLSTLGQLVFNGQSLVIISVGGITDSGNSVNIDLSSQSGAGGNLSLIAGYNFTPNGAGLNYPPLDKTSSFVITSAGSGSISLANTTINTSGLSSAGSVLVVANGSIALGAISANATTGTGGSINIIGNGVTISGNVDTTSLAGANLGGLVSVNAANPLQTGTIVVGGGFVAGGSFTPGAANGSISVGKINSGASAINLIANGSGASITSTGELTSGNINLATSGAINIASGQTFALQNDSAGNGGHLILSAASLNWADSTTQALVIDASAAGASGNGGSIVLNLQSTTPISIGTQAGTIQLIAKGGTNAGSGGSVAVSTGGNLSVAPTGIDISPNAANSNGGQIVLEAGTAGSGTLLVSGPLSASGTGTGNGGAIKLVSNSATLFNVGSTAKTNTNGVHGGLFVAGSGGTLQIINEGGGITNAVALNSVTNLSETASGTGILALGSSLAANKGLQLVSLTTDKGTITKSGTLTTAKIVLQSKNGNIGTSGAGFSVVANEVQASAGGLVNITDTIKSNVSLDASSAATSFKLVSSGALIINGALTAGTAATLTTSGSNLGITIDGDVRVTSATGTALLTATGKGIIDQSGAGGTVQAHTLTLKTTSGTFGTPVRALNINAAVLNLTTTGAINIENAGISPLTVNGSATKGTFDLTSAGSIVIAKAITSATSYSLTTNSGSNGSITINAALGGTKAATIVIDADGNGNINGSVSNKLQTAANGTVTLTSDSGNIGSGTTNKTTLNLYTTNFSANTGGTGFVNIASKLTSPVAVKSSTSGADFDLYSAGASALSGITSSGGSINVIEATGALSVNPLTTIHAGNGSITLENANKASGTILIGESSQITTMSTSTTGGQVNIVLGPVPSNPVAGTAPTSGLTVNQVSGGSVFFGKGITVQGPVSTINLQGSNVVFNVGTRPISAITLGGSDTITADPVISPGYAPILNVVEKFLTATSLSPEFTKPITIALPTSANTLPITGTSSNRPLYASHIPGSQGLANFSIAAIDGSLSSSSSNINFAGQINNNKVTEPRWISETELQTGEIPATVFEGESFGIKNEISSILEMDEASDLPSSNNNTQAVLRAEYAGAGSLLTGGVSRTVTNPQTKVVNLKRGSVIFATDKDTVVSTQFCNIKIAANSVAMIMAFGKGVAVYNLLDKHKDAVVATLGDRNISIRPGAVTVVCSGEINSLREVNPAQVIGYRDLQTHKLDCNLQIFSGQFSIIHAMANVIPLRAMVNSRTSQSKKTAAQILKTAAILNQLNVADYQQIIKPTQTAFLGQPN